MIILIVIGAVVAALLARELFRAITRKAPANSVVSYEERAIDGPPVMGRGRIVQVVHEADYFDRLEQIPGARRGARSIRLTGLATLMYVDMGEGPYVGVVFSGVQVGDLSAKDVAGFALFLESSGTTGNKARAAATLEGGWSVTGDPWFRVTLDCDLPVAPRAASSR